LKAADKVRVVLNRDRTNSHGLFLRLLFAADFDV